MNRITISLGILAGLILSLAYLLPLAGTDFANIPADKQVGDGLGYGIMLISASGAVVAMVISSRMNKLLTFGQLVKTGLLTAVVTTAVFYIANIIFYEFIEPDFLNNYLNHVIQRKAATMTDEVKKAEYLANSQKDTGLYTNSYLYAAIMSATVFMICLMPVAICGYILFRLGKRKNLVK